MIYHDLDLYILEKILTTHKISTWDLAKRYDWNEDCEKDEHYWKNKCTIIIKRLQKMEEEGLVIILKNKNYNDYSIIGENVVLKRIKFPNKKYGNCLFIKETRSKWQVFEI